MYFLNHLVMDQQGWSRLESSVDLIEAIRRYCHPPEGSTC
jgi:hypothetical protein